MDQSSKVHSEEDNKQIANKKYRNSNKHADWWLQYYQKQADINVSGALFLSGSNFQYGKKAINDHSTVWQPCIDSRPGEPSRPFESYRPFQTVQR